jgi:DNA-directed RNA polymerase subunit RPC12/RpoP
MRRPGGIILETDLSTGNVKEYDTAWCGHCGKHVPMWKHQAGTGYWCSHCGKTVCQQCATKGDCDPLPAKLERWASRERLYQNIKEC